MISHMYNHHQFIYQWKAPLIICFESISNAYWYTRFWFSFFYTRTTPYQIPFDKAIYKIVVYSINIYGFCLQRTTIKNIQPLKTPFNHILVLRFPRKFVCWLNHYSFLLTHELYSWLYSFLRPNLLIILLKKLYF